MHSSKLTPESFPMHKRNYCYLLISKNYSIFLQHISPIVDSELNTYTLCTFNSKINDSPKRCLLAHFEAIHSILAGAIYFAHDNITMSNYVQKSSVASKWASEHLGVPFILLYT